MTTQSNSRFAFGIVLISLINAPACTDLDSASEPLASAKQGLDLENGVNWNGVNWNGVNWNGVNWNGVNWNGVNWNGVNWNGVNWNGVNWNGVNWNGVNWNGVNWNGVNWNGVNWNGIDWTQAEASNIDWTAIDWQGIDANSVDWAQVAWSGDDWSQENFQGISSGWAGFGWFMSGTDSSTSTDVGAFVLTNPSLRSWIYDAPTSEERSERLYLLGKLVAGSACEGWPVVFGEVDGEMISWQGGLCLAPSMWTLGPQSVEQRRLLSAFIISLFNTTSMEVSLRAPVPGLSSTAAEQLAYSVPQGCYAGDLFATTPVVRAYSTHTASATAAQFANRACRIDLDVLNALPLISLDGNADFQLDICGIEWTNADQEVPLAGFETGDNSATTTHCDPANSNGEVANCRVFSYEQRPHATHGDIQVATSVEDYPTVCAYL